MCLNGVSSHTKIEKELESLQNEVISLITQLSKSLEGNEQIEKDLKDAIQALRTVKEDCDQEIKKSFREMRGSEKTSVNRSVLL